MSLAPDQVRDWLKELDPPLSISSAADLAGMTRIALSQQLLRGKVKEQSVVAICRSLALDPLEELARFREYADLAPATPGRVEALAFIDWPELFQAAGWAYRGTRFGDRDLGPTTFPESSRIWVDTLDAGSGALRTEVAEDIGVSAAAITHAISAGLKPHVAAAFARRAGTSVASALVAADVLTPREAGWYRDARSWAVHDTPVPELLDLVGARSVMASRHERKTHTFEEELG